MAQQIFFSAKGIQLSTNQDEDAHSAVITLSNEINSIERELKHDELAEFYRATRYLLMRINYSTVELMSSSTEQFIIDTLTYLKNHGVDSEVFKNVYESWLSSVAVGDEGTWFRTRNQIIEADVFIGLPQEDIDLFTIEQIQNASGDFMEAMGFELETKDEPVFGSFYQRLKFLLKGEVKEEVSDIYNKGKTALEMQFISVPHAEATSKLAMAAASVITALSTTENAALRLGAILLVKVTRDGVPQIVTETISPELSALLDKNPALLQNPNIVFDLISGMRAPDKTIGESGSAEIME